MSQHRMMSANTPLSFRKSLDVANVSTNNLAILFLAIGNPSNQFAGTRHNVGKWAIEKMATEAWPDFSPFSHDKYLGSVATSRSDKSAHAHVVLAKTKATFMNISGPVVAKAWQKFKKENAVNNPCLVVLHDELQVPLGKVQIRRRNTSARGHNGLRSIDKTMGNDYTKLAIGINKKSGSNVADYVLAKFNPSEQRILEVDTMPLLMDIMEQMVAGKHVMDKFVGKQGT
ncbi:hypothetical protein JCM33374_g5529 [Metschnikowia sp. JCM 33374]|nr:hypothetical protein JCM33374_g5529 [Metschnikowia sp. JCM 33374]